MFDGEDVPVLTMNKPLLYVKLFPNATCLVFVWDELVKKIGKALLEKASNVAEDYDVVTIPDEAVESKRSRKVYAIPVTDQGSLLVLKQCPRGLLLLPPVTQVLDYHVYRLGDVANLVQVIERARAVAEEYGNKLFAVIDATRVFACKYPNIDVGIRRIRLSCKSLLFIETRDEKTIHDIAIPLRRIFADSELDNKILIVEWQGRAPTHVVEIDKSSMRPIVSPVQVFDMEMSTEVTRLFSQPLYRKKMLQLVQEVKSIALRDKRLDLALIHVLKRLMPKACSVDVTSGVLCAKFETSKRIGRLIATLFEKLNMLVKDRQVTRLDLKNIGCDKYVVEICVATMLRKDELQSLLS